jgi:hypothetical protein
LFVAVGYAGTIHTSPYGMTWTKQTSNTTATLNKIIYINDMFVVVGGIILSSPDGIKWTKEMSQTGIILDIIYANNVFVAVGNYGTIRVCNFGMRISLA